MLKFSSLAGQNDNISIAVWSCGPNDPLYKEYTFLRRFVIGRVSITPWLITGVLQWRQSERDGVSNHQPHDCLLNRLLRHISKKISKVLVTGLCEGNSPVTGEFPAQKASNAENVSTSWRHNGQAISWANSDLVQWLTCASRRQNWF